MKSAILPSLLFATCAACGAPQPGILASTPSTAVGDGQGAIDPPPSALTVQLEPVPWSPVTIGGSGAATLAQALSKQSAIMVLTGERMTDEEWDDRIFQMVKAAAPDTKIVARNRGVLDDILMERGEIPFRQTWEVGGADVFGRPFMVPKDHPLKTDWLSKETVLKGAGAILLVDIIQPDSRKMNELRSARQGDCSGLLAALDAAVSGSAEHFSPLKEQLNKVLAEEFSRQMKEALPFWNEEIDDALAARPAGQEARCLSAYDGLLQSYEPCLSGPCAVGPAVFPIPAGVIGMEMSQTVTVPHDCPVGMGRDYVRELEAIGRRVVDSLLKQIPAKWAEDLARVDAVNDLRATMADICAPAHRRYTQESLDKARADVLAFIEQVPQTKVDGEWVSASGRERVPGTGSVVVLAKAVAGSGNLDMALQSVADGIRAMERCRDSRRRPMQVVLIDVGTSEVYFSAIVFEEQLFCEDMAPMSAPAP